MQKDRLITKIRVADIEAKMDEQRKLIDSELERERQESAGILQINQSVSENIARCISNSMSHGTIDRSHVRQLQQLSPYTVLDAWMNLKP